MAIAFEWVSKITAIALEIVIVIVLGRWLDVRLGTTFLGLIALFVGPALGFLHLLQLVGIIGGQQGDDASSKDKDS